MPPSRSHRPPKPTITVEADGVRPAYKIRGLADAGTLPIQYDGRTFNLKRLSAEELSFLLAHPDQVPYLVKG